MKLAKLTYLILLFTFLCALPGYGQIIRSQTQKWSMNLDSDDLSSMGEAGSDLVSTHTTTNRLDVAGITPSTGWRVTVSKIDINWPVAFTPSTQRTSVGTPCGTCSGVNTGTSVSGWLTITDIEQDFIFGVGVVNDIDLDYRIEGVSLAVPASTYQTTVVFTLYGDP